MTSTTVAPAAQPSPFDLVHDMEDDVYAIRDFAHALVIVGQSISENEGAVVSRIAFAIMDLAEEVEVKRAAARLALHSRRGEPGFRADGEVGEAEEDPS